MYLSIFSFYIYLFNTTISFQSTRACFIFTAETMSETTKTPRVLSIQSHVVHGYVGNKSATFPLQVCEA